MSLDYLVLKMTVGLAVLGLVNAISIDNHLITTKTDCYERLAIGERIDPRDVTKTFSLSTVAECQTACSEEDIKCLSFSFGIDPKGNSTCELTYMRIQETEDLRPVGTMHDPDYDLYVKKLGCKLNIPKDPPSSPTFVSDEPSVRPDHPSDAGYFDPHSKPASVPHRPDHTDYNRPAPDILEHHKPVDTHKPTYLVTILDKPSHGFDRPGDRPNYNQYGSGSRYEVQEPQYDTGNKNNKYKPGGASDYGDVLILHDTDGPYQNYYGVNRPLPQRPQDGDRNKLNSYPRPVLPYNDDYYYGMPRPVSSYRPLTDYYSFDNPNNYPDSHRPYESGYQKPHIPNVDSFSGYKPNYERPYRPSSPEDNRPYGSEPDRKPYGPELSNSNGNVRPSIDKPSSSSRPYRPRPETDRYKPYIPGPNYDEKRPYIPNRYDPNQSVDKYYGSNQNKPYDSNNPNSYDNKPSYSDKPYNSNSGNKRPYDDQNNKPYRPEPIKPIYNDRDKNIYQDSRLFSERPFDPYWNHVKPHPISPDNPNYYDDVRPIPSSGYSTNWDRNSDNSKPVYPSHGFYQNTTGNAKPQGTTNSGYPGSNSNEVQLRPGGGSITSSITEITDPCFRRVLPGKRLQRNFIKKAVPCERVEDCHRECAIEKRFVCEGFNYRLDPTGHGQGDCELSDVPLSRVDIGRDIIPDREYDYYEKDRNSGSDCHPLRLPSYGPGRYPPSGGHRYGTGGGHGYPPSSSGRPQRPISPYPPSGGGRYPPSGGGGRYPPSGGGSYPPSGGGSRYPSDRYRPDHGSRYPPAPVYPPSHRAPQYGERKDIAYPPYDHHHTYIDTDDHHGYMYGYHYPIRSPPPYLDDRPYHPHPQPPYDHQPSHERDQHRRIDHHYTPHYLYQDSYYHDRERDRTYWGLSQFERPTRWGTYGGSYGNFGAPDSYYGHGSLRNENRYDGFERRSFVPYRIGQVGGPHDWGQYGGSYGTGHSYYQSGGKHEERYNYWGFNQDYRPDDFHSDRKLFELRPTGNRRLNFDHDSDHYSPLDDHYGGLHGFDHGIDRPYGGGHTNHIGYESDYHHGPPRPRPDDCSSRRGMGFRLHKAVVKKYFAVPNIHECEKLCYMEKQFPCVSFSYRYSITLSSPSDNCYLSDRPFKELDFYTDLEPDRDFDVYTMHKTESCLIPVIIEESECFLRVRSGQRLDHTVVKDSMDVKSIVDCQLECLASRRFTCRSFSYRFGPPLRGGAIDNCQLSDWPYTELDVRRDVVPEPGYEIYERGSYGHGCEEDHFIIPGYRHGIPDGSVIPKPSDKICYVGYAKPARLSSEATKGALSVATELDCKAECTRAREHTQFPCMSFSYRNVARKGEPNCELSDIEQRDLLPELDYIKDPDSWLFAWDNYSPQCSPLPGPDHHTGDPRYPPDSHNPLDTWRTYSVSGWPCRRGSTCRENREAGFWSCELEGGEVGSWDYCCRPDHRCGYSHGYGYPWCYVGPTRDQWRKCSDRYYPYIHHTFIPDKHTSSHSKPPYGVTSYEPYIPRPGSSSWHSERPYRPPHQRPLPQHLPRPSLDEYEHKFSQQFLDPPTPGGFGSGRHWPVSYLHKEMPPNTTLADPDRQDRQMSQSTSKYSAINNLVDTIKSNDLKNLNYHITNQSNSADEILLVRIPMPGQSEKMTQADSDKILKFDVVDTKPEKRLDVERKFDDFDDLFLISVPKNNNKTETFTVRTPKRDLRMFPLIRRGFVTRTNRTERKLQILTNRDRLQYFNS